MNGDPLAKYGTEHAGGQVKYIFELGSNLVREGWNIDVYTIRNDAMPICESVTEGFNVIRFALPENNNYSYEITTSEIKFVGESILRYIASNNLSYNLILCCYWVSGLIGLTLKKELHKNVIMSFCSLGYLKKERSELPHTLDKRILSETLIAQECDHIIATTLEEKNILVNEYKISPNKISIIPRGIDLNVFYKY